MQGITSANILNQMTKILSALSTRKRTHLTLNRLEIRLLISLNLWSQQMRRLKNIWMKIKLVGPSITFPLEIDATSSLLICSPAQSGCF